MTGKVFNGIEEITTGDLGVSDWLLVDQERVNTFADATGDHQWIHVDPERAADGPFGGTIAHGLLTLSLLPHFQFELIRVDNISMGINYGYNKVRFINPVRVGSRLRARAEVTSVEQKPGAVDGDHRDHRRDRRRRQAGLCGRVDFALHHVTKFGVSFQAGPRRDIAANTTVGINNSKVLGVIPILAQWNHNLRFVNGLDIAHHSVAKISPRTTTMCRSRRSGVMLLLSSGPAFSVTSEDGGPERFGREGITWVTQHAVVLPWGIRCVRS
ncbi:enoyl-CoA hydratase 1 [Mycobacteroides abscessus subsp. abscessus]|nr:enoyl-CoA hydratase 1 [Mycobacteroides abscessus subsp. abscessus]SIL20520.1 enoyl-CoA hydratase 1 [Mycobacteroides abscessus subsp. abscessus]SKG97815.1 enoyl-CoA hydratase 1 [Mycobacteroides abscessus subsp. abscessus]